MGTDSSTAHKYRAYTNLLWASAGACVYRGPPNALGAPWISYRCVPCDRAGRTRAAQYKPCLTSCDAATTQAIQVTTGRVPCFPHGVSQHPQSAGMRRQTVPRSLPTCAGASVIFLRIPNTSTAVIAITNACLGRHPPPNQDYNNAHSGGTVQRHGISGYIWAGRGVLFPVTWDLPLRWGWNIPPCVRAQPEHYSCVMRHVEEQADRTGTSLMGNRTMNKHRWAATAMYQKRATCR